jgi:16S rRNA processing protein RimM
MYLIGNILKPHGIRGEVKVLPVSPDPGRFYDLDYVYIQTDQTQRYVIEHRRVTGEFVFLKFCEVNSRTEAEELRGKEILISKDHLIELDTNEYFVHDLVGCMVIDENSNPIGKVIEVMQQSSNDIYVVKDARANEYLIPAIGEVVKKVDVKDKKIVIHPMEGLIG